MALYFSWWLVRHCRQVCFEHHLYFFAMDLRQCRSGRRSDPSRCPSTSTSALPSRNLLRMQKRLRPSVVVPSRFKVQCCAQALEMPLSQDRSMEDEPGSTPDTVNTGPIPVPYPGSFL